MTTQTAALTTIDGYATRLTRIELAKRDSKGGWKRVGTLWYEPSAAIPSPSLDADEQIDAAVATLNKSVTSAYQWKRMSTRP